MAWYDFSVGDRGFARIWDVQSRGRQNPGSLVGAVFSVDVVRPINSDGTYDDHLTWTEGFEGLADGQLSFTPSEDAEFDEEGDWVFHASYSLGAGWETLDPIIVHVGPQGGLTPGSVVGATTIDGLNAQIAALSLVSDPRSKLRIRLPRRTYVMQAGEQIVGASNVVLDISAAIIDCTALTGDFDDPENAAIVVEGTISTSVVNTTVDGNHVKNSLTLELAVGQGAAGDYIVVDGDNEGEVDHWQVCRIRSRVGTTVTLEWPLEYRIEDGERVRGITPVTGFELVGGYIDAEDGGLAVGLLASGFLDLYVGDVTFRGMSRAAINLRRGGVGARIEDLKIDGQVNCNVFSDACHDVTIDGQRHNPEGDRSHADGYARHAIVMRWGGRPRVKHLNLQRVCGGVRLAAMHHGSLDDCHYRDIDGTRLQSDGSASGELPGSSKDGVAISLAYGPALNPNLAAYGYGMQITKQVIEDVTCPDIMSSVDLHDYVGLDVAGMILSNIGPGQGARAMRGVHIADIEEFSIRGLEFKGISRCIHTENSATRNGFIDDVMMNMAVQDGGVNGDEAFIFDHVRSGGTGNSQLRIRGVKVINQNKLFGFGASFLADPEYTMEIFDLTVDGFSATRLALFTSVGAQALYDVVQQVTGTSVIGTPAAQCMAPLVVCLGPGDATSGPMFCALMEGVFFARATGPVLVGQQVEATAGKRVQASALTDNRAPAVALTAVGGGGGIIQLRAA